MSTATLPAPLDPAWPAAPWKQIDDACKLNDLEDKLSVDGAVLLEHISQFIGRYLECSEHQRTIMALWVLHTHALSAAQVTPYLSIRSTEKHSGKTLCLQLLKMLIKDHALTTGFTASAITRRMDPYISTILLDECEATVGTRARPKSPMLRAILASGYHSGPGYTDATHERNVFAPKAFAGEGQLPEKLADRSISIILEPLKDRTKIQRFDQRRVYKEAEPLLELLDAWSEYNRPELEDMRAYSYAELPSDLPPRQLDVMEPLLRLAEMVGGPWPERIREAFADAFKKAADVDLKQSVELLADIRDCFAFHNYPERLSTATFLEWLHGLPSRPWDVDGPITARKLANLLAPFAIHPRFQRMGKESSARGYQLQDFVPLWQKHLAFDPASVAHATESQIPNNHGPCSAVADVQRRSGNNASTPGAASDSSSQSRISSGPISYGAVNTAAPIQPPAPPKPVMPARPPIKPHGEELTPEEREAGLAWIRQQREAPPKCAERENFRLASQKRK